MELTEALVWKIVAGLSFSAIGFLLKLYVDDKVKYMNEKLDDFKTQQQRFVSHLESERRVSANQGKRIDDCTKENDRQQRLLELHDEILRNGKGGLVMRIDRLERNEKKE
jgi:hypothetical protein